MNKKSLRYTDAGVDVARWEHVKKGMAQHVAESFNPRVLGAFGGFGGVFDAAPLCSYRHPVLVSSVDGVGTKLKVAFAAGIHDTIGEDLVNHCIDDILVCGARPLFFLDYLGCGTLEEHVATEVVRGFARACKAADCPLIGGETAEMPGFYQRGEYDVSGTIVGAAERDTLVDGTSIAAGDVLVGCSSNGLHTNGYSLARKIVTEYAAKTYGDTFEETGRTFAQELLRVHRSYLPLYETIISDAVKGCAHITGGGFRGNVNRILPDTCDAVIDTTAWEPEPIFRFLQNEGGVDPSEMYDTFNMGIGFILVTSPQKAPSVRQAARAHDIETTIVGEITRGSGAVHMH